MHVAWGLAVACFANASARADDVHVVPCRPTVSCTADLAPPGTLELELGYQAQRVDANGGVTQTTPFLIKLPLAHWIEVQLGDNGYTIATGQRYLDNLVAGAKLHLADQSGARPSVAITLAASIPTVAEEGYTRQTDLFVTAQASKDFGKLHVDANAGLYAWQLAGPVGYQPFVVIAGTYAVTSKRGLALEPHYLANAAPAESLDVGVLAAAEYAIRSWLVVDAAFEVTFADPGSVTGLAGLSIAPVRLWEGR
jgi:hypothetical protein